MTMMRIYNIREAASRNALLTYPPFTVSPSECLCTLAAGSFGGGRARAALESKFSRFSQPDEAHFPSEKLTALRHIVLYRTHLGEGRGIGYALHPTTASNAGGAATTLHARAFTSSGRMPVWGRPHCISQSLSNRRPVRRHGLRSHGMLCRCGMETWLHGTLAACTTLSQQHMTCFA